MIAKFLSAFRAIRNGASVTDVKTDPGGGANITAQHFGAPGDDACPLPGDYVTLIGVPRTGGRVAVGYLDPANAQETAAGERRLYARNSAGTPVVEVWLKNDGSAVISNTAGSITLQAGGDVVINGATITTGGDVVTAAGVSLDGHTHAQGNDSGGDAEVETDPPTVV